jgi:hypothetical protein
MWGITRKFFAELRQPHRLIGFLSPFRFKGSLCRNHKTNWAQIPKSTTTIYNIKPHIQSFQYPEPLPCHTCDSSTDNDKTTFYKIWLILVVPRQTVTVVITSLRLAVSLLVKLCRPTIWLAYQLAHMWFKQECESISCSFNNYILKKELPNF